MAAAAPTTKDSSSCPFALRQWLAVGCGGASCCQVRCQRVSSRLIVLLLQCMYIHDVPRSLCTVGRWERTCEDWNKEATSPVNLDVHTVDPACFSRPAYRMRVPVQGTNVQSVVPVIPHVTRYTCCCSHPARGTLQDQQLETSRKSHELACILHPPLTSPNRETRRRLACSCLFLPSRAEASRLPSDVPAPDLADHTARLLLAVGRLWWLGTGSSSSETS